MPELPEVETTVQAISNKLLTQKIDSLEVHESRLRYPFKHNWVEKIDGQTIVKINRRGKYIIIKLVKGALIIHLGMTGKLYFANPQDPLKKHDHFEFKIGNMNLRYNDPRRFGCLIWTNNDPLQHALLLNLGKEPFSKTFSGDYLHRKGRKSETTIKNFIMNNKVVVGVGNIYANEALYLAGIHPKRKTCNISLKRCDELAYSIKRVLAKAIRSGGTTIKDYFSPSGEPGYFKNKLYVYGRKNESCRRCKNKIKRMIIGQRSSFYCSHCQT